MYNLRKALFVLFTMLMTSTALAAEQPNIVLVFMDNFGWGEHFAMQVNTSLD